MDAEAQNHGPRVEAASVPSSLPPVPPMDVVNRTIGDLGDAVRAMLAFTIWLPIKLGILVLSAGCKPHGEAAAPTARSPQPHADSIVDAFDQQQSNSSSASAHSTSFSHAGGRSPARTSATGLNTLK